MSHRFGQAAHEAPSGDSWVEISSQPSSSSLSSAAADEAATVPSNHTDHVPDRRRRLRHNAPSALPIAHHSPSAGDMSSQDEYEESESESDRIMTSSNEGPPITLPHLRRHATQSAAPLPPDDDDDENRTAVNYPIRNDQPFTPQPNAFSHPPTRQASMPVAGSYFPSQRRLSHHQRPPMPARHSLPDSHTPHNILSPSYNAAAHHEALRTSLSTLLSCAAAARGLPKPNVKREQNPASSAPPLQRAGNRVDPASIRLVAPGSAMPPAATATTATRPSPHLGLEEPTFKPTIRRNPSSTSASSSRGSPPTTLARADASPPTKRKTPRTASRDRQRTSKKARRASSASTSSDTELVLTPTLLTWLVSAGVVVVLSALSFRAGYSLGREAGRLDCGPDAASWGVLASSSSPADEPLRGCAREAGRQSLGLRRSLARSAVQV